MRRGGTAGSKHLNNGAVSHISVAECLTALKREGIHLKQNNFGGECGDEWEARVRVCACV